MLLDVFSNGFLNAFKAMESSLEDGSVRTDKHEMRNALDAVDICRNIAAIVDVKPVHSKLTCNLDCV